MIAVVLVENSDKDNIIISINIFKLKDNIIQQKTNNNEKKAKI